jgi:hypothetical protein
MTPNIAIVEIRNAHWRCPRLWLPLFLLWIPALLLAPLLLIVVVGVSLAGRISPWRTIAVL